MSAAVVHRIVQDVLRIEAQIGKFPSQEEYDAVGKYGPLITRYFGGWDGVVRAVGRIHAKEEEEKREPKILLFDLETSPMELLGFGLYDQNFSLNQIKRDWFLLSIAAKWLAIQRLFTQTRETKRTFPKILGC